MNKEPIGLYVLRFILAFGLFAFMTMLYWSSLLVEQDLKFIKGDLFQIKNELMLIKGDINQEQKDQNSQTLIQDQEKKSPDEVVNSPINLLNKDPFYLKTLPALLGPGFKPQGIRREAQLGRPNNLHPFNNLSYIASWNALCTLPLVGQKVGIYETYTPEMALSMEIRNAPDGRPEYWLFLRKDVYWEPLNPLHFQESVQLAPTFFHKHRVTAHDFKFYFDAVMNPHVEEGGAVAMRVYFNNIEEVRVIDDFTLVVRWKTIPIIDEEGKETYKMQQRAKLLTGSLRPLPRFVYQYFADGTKIVSDDSNPDTYRTHPIWAQNFSHHWANNVIVSCGPWLFDGMTDREIRFRRNPNYFDPLAVLVNGYEVTFQDSQDAIWENFKTAGLDLFEVPANLLSELDLFLQSAPYQKQSRKGLGIKRLNYLSRIFYYVGWNEIRPFFISRKVRQALTLAIDRERIIRQNLNGMAIQTTGPFFPLSPSYNPHLEPYPFDPYKARQLLQEEGWYDSDGDGIIDKLIDGKRVPFRFKLTYYVKGTTTKAIVDYICSALKEIGIECRPHGVDVADLSVIFEDKDFDAVAMGWVLSSPPEDPKQIWYSTGAKERGSSNAISFANPEVDRIIDQLEYESDPEKRVKLYHEFDQIIYDEAPYTFLFVPKTTLAFREYLQNVFIPAERQDLIPGANVGEPLSSLFWIKESH